MSESVSTADRPPPPPPRGSGAARCERQGGIRDGPAPSGVSRGDDARNGNKTESKEGEKNKDALHASFLPDSHIFIRCLSHFMIHSLPAHVHFYSCAQLTIRFD